MKTPAEIARQVLRETFSSPIRPDGAALRGLMMRAIEADRAQLYERVLTFEPDAIRDHFEADEDDDPTKGLTDEQLDKIGQAALTDDRLYQAFHAALVTAINDY